MPCQWAWGWEEAAEEEPSSDDPVIDPEGAKLLAMLHKQKPQQRRHHSCYGRVEWQARETEQSAAWASSNGTKPEATEHLAGEGRSQPSSGAWWPQ